MQLDDINYVDVSVAPVETNAATQHDVEESINEKAASSDQPPEATQPLSHTKCCIPKAFEGIKNPKDKNCFGTCYSAGTCNDPIYPFTSAEEKRQFPLNNLTKYSAKVRRKLRRQCLEPERMTPPVEWCQKPTFGGGKEGEKTTNGTIAAAAPAQLVKDIPPAGCSLAVGHSSGSGAFQHGKVFSLCV